VDLLHGNGGISISGFENQINRFFLSVYHEEYWDYLWQ